MTTDDAGTTTMTPMLYASDHLGSVRSVVNGLTGETVETNDYYPFGGKWNDGSSSDPTNRYRYNGKEEQLLFSTPYSDYGARQYSSASARWLTLDPLANKYYGISPYAFCANNPVNYIDPDGRVIDIVVDIISIGCGISSLYKNIREGNTKAAWVDAAGIGVDLIFAFVPGVTVGVGATKNITKSAINIADEVMDSKGAWGLKSFDRGNKIEYLRKGWNSNYPTIDKYDEVTMTATSIKSLDLNAKTYQSGNAVYNKVKGYIDKLANFTGGSWGGKVVNESDMQNRVLELVVPTNSTTRQIEQLNNLKEYAKQSNIQLSIIIAE